MSSDMQQIRQYFGSALPCVAYHCPNAERSKALENLYLNVAQRLNLPMYVYDIYGGLEQIVPAVETDYLLPDGERFEGDVCHQDGEWYTGNEYGSDSILLTVINRTVSGIDFSPINAEFDHPVLDIFRFIEAHKGSGIFILSGFHKFLEGSKQLLEAVAAVERLSQRLKETYKRILFMGQDIRLGTEFSGIVYEVRATLPSKEALAEEINLLIEATSRDFRAMGVELGVSLSGDDRESLAVAAQGLTVEQTRNALLIDMRARRRVDAQSADVLIAAKVEEFSKLNIRFGTTPDVLSGGVEVFQDWVEKRGQLFNRTAYRQQTKLKLAPPKGCLLVGPPGTGKSLAAKVIAYRWKCPILSVNIGDFMGGIVGETEKNWRQFTDLVEHLGPVVVHLDEIEKGLAGASGESTDSGVSQRLFGAILSWMNDKTCPAFVVATANDISKLPPEFLRKGRFDEIWFMDVPNTAERLEILQIHLHKHQVVLGDAELNQIVAATKEFVGAELKQCVDDAAYLAAGEGLDTIEVRHLLETAGSTNPLSKSQAARLHELRTWALSGARNASEPDVEVSHLAAKAAKAAKTKPRLLLDSDQN